MKCNAVRFRTSCCILPTNFKKRTISGKIDAFLNFVGEIQQLLWKRSHIFTGNSPLGALAFQERIGYFWDIKSDKLIIRIAEESNTYATQVNINKPLIDIFFLVSIMKIPGTRDY